MFEDEFQIPQPTLKQSLLSGPGPLPTLISDANHRKAALELADHSGLWDQRRLLPGLELCTFSGGSRSLYLSGAVPIS